MFILPYAILGILTIIVVTAGVYGWEYTNSPPFCGYTCHTMPPQNATYIVSPHANVYCTECHIGRASLANQIARKSEDVRELYSMLFHTYEFPIVASRSRPARETCEECHQPQAFSADSLQVITHFDSDIQNTPYDIYLILKTGGGAKEQGLGRGIHWHILNPVYYYATDTESQNIPYIRVVNDDGSYTEYVDIESGFDPANMDESQLKEIDCITCHNRATHDFKQPEISVDTAMARGLIDPSIPEIHKRALLVLSTKYQTRDEAMDAIDVLENFYLTNDYYKDYQAQIPSAMQAIRDIFDQTVFIDQKVDWTTHPNNLGHIYSPGCFRCHDGKHLDAQQQAIRLECNLCHSIPVVAGAQDFVSSIEISRGPEPSSHLNPNWIALHRDAFDLTCSNCHTTDNPGGTTNTSFCSNSACHGSTYTYAGFDAPALRAILQAQLPKPSPTPVLEPVEGKPAFDSYIGPLLANKCIVCHGENASAGLNFTTYVTTMKGGDDGPVIIAGDSQASKLVQVQSSTHFANLSAEELDFVKQWIDAGAPEK